MTDGGQPGTSSDGIVFNPRTGKTWKRTEPSDTTFPRDVQPKTSPTLGIPKEYTELAQIVASLPEGFDLTGWDGMTAFQQQKAIQNSGLSEEDQMVMLNASTSVETIAMIQGLQAHHALYGLTQNETDSLSKQLLEIANARIGVKTHNYPIFPSNLLTQAFLGMLAEQESALLAPFRQAPGSSESTLERLQALSDKRTPLPIGKYIGYNKIDLTESLNPFMHQSADMLREMQASARSKHVSFIPAFISAVETGGLLDIKNQSSWTFTKGLEYFYRGMPLRNDDPGNIAFGYYGAAVFGKEFLQLGAGLYQLLSDIRNNEPIQLDGKYFDNPRDNEMIRYGYELYVEENKP